MLQQDVFKRTWRRARRTALPGDQFKTRFKVMSQGMNQGQGMVGLEAA